MITIFQDSVIYSLAKTVIGLFIDCENGDLESRKEIMK